MCVCVCVCEGVSVCVCAVLTQIELSREGGRDRKRWKSTIAIQQQ